MMLFRLPIQRLLSTTARSISTTTATAFHCRQQSSPQQPHRLSPFSRHSAFPCPPSSTRTFVSQTSPVYQDDQRHPLERLFRDDEDLIDSETGKFNVGRSWRASELRLKSFEDLHALWFVLLKERNVLETERWVARKAKSQMLNPARLKKVRVSMSRIKTILGERSMEYKATNQAAAVVEMEDATMEEEVKV